LYGASGASFAGRSSTRIEQGRCGGLLVRLRARMNSAREVDVGERVPDRARARLIPLRSPAASREDRAASAAGHGIISAPFRPLRYHRVPPLEDLVLLSRRPLRLAAWSSPWCRRDMGVAWRGRACSTQCGVRAETSLAHRCEALRRDPAIRRLRSSESRMVLSESLRLLQDMKSASHRHAGGIAQFPDCAHDLYVPVDLLRGEETMDQIGDLHYRRIAVGAPKAGAQRLRRAAAQSTVSTASSWCR
jgi:hypothetical protein